MLFAQSSWYVESIFDNELAFGSRKNYGHQIPFIYLWKQHFFVLDKRFRFLLERACNLLNIIFTQFRSIVIMVTELWFHQYSFMTEVITIRILSISVIYGILIRTKIPFMKWFHYFISDTIGRSYAWMEFLQIIIPDYKTLFVQTTKMR